MFEVVWLSLFVWFASKAQDLAFAFVAGAAYQPLACPCQVTAEWDVSDHCMKDAPTAAGISRPVEAISGRHHTLLLSPSGPLLAPRLALLAPSGTPSGTTPFRATAPSGTQHTLGTPTIAVTSLKQRCHNTRHNGKERTRWTCH